MVRKGQKGHEDEINVNWRIKSRWNSSLIFLFSCSILLKEVCCFLGACLEHHRCRQQKTWSKNCSSASSKCLLNRLVSPWCVYLYQKIKKGELGFLKVNLSHDSLSKGWNSWAVCHPAWTSICAETVLVFLIALTCGPGVGFICLPFTGEQWGV